MSVYRKAAAVFLLAVLLPSLGHADLQLSAAATKNRRPTDRVQIRAILCSIAACALVPFGYPEYATAFAAIGILNQEPSSILDLTRTMQPEGLADYQTFIAANGPVQIQMGDTVETLVGKGMSPLAAQSLMQTLQAAVVQ